MNHVVLEVRRQYPKHDLAVVDRVLEHPDQDCWMNHVVPRSRYLEDDVPALGHLDHVLVLLELSDRSRCP